MKREVELAKKLLESKGYSVDKKSNISEDRVLSILRNHHDLMEKLKK